MKLIIQFMVELVGSFVQEFKLSLVFYAIFIKLAYTTMNGFNGVLVSFQETEAIPNFAYKFTCGRILLQGVEHC